MDGPPVLNGLENIPRRATIAVALSGGVDSAMAAWRLRESGYKVQAYHLILSHNANSLSAAQTMAAVLGVDLEPVDLAADFDRLVIEPFVRSYLEGRTPSPCVLCNPLIKFGRLATYALARGAERLATGHYAALTPHGGLARPADRAKDQTYFLSQLGPKELALAVFPLADWTKTQVIEQAFKLGLPVQEESQEFCFLAGQDYRAFLARRLGSAAMTPGDLVDSRGRVLGRHHGLINYTVGQRRGLGLPGPEPYYVLSLDHAANRVVIGIKSQVRFSGLMAGEIVWNRPLPERVFKAEVQIRSRHRPAEAEVTVLSGDRAQVYFDQPQEAVTPGQAVAFYSNELVLGGGWIQGAIRGRD